MLGCPLACEGNTNNAHIVSLGLDFALGPRLSTEHYTCGRSFPDNVARKCYDCRVNYMETFRRRAAVCWSRGDAGLAADFQCGIRDRRRAGAETSGFTRQSGGRGSRASISASAPSSKSSVDFQVFGYTPSLKNIWLLSLGFPQYNIQMVLCNRNLSSWDDHNRLSIIQYHRRALNNVSYVQAGKLVDRRVLHSADCVEVDTSSGLFLL